MRYLHHTGRLHLLVFRAGKADNEAIYVSGGVKQA